MNNSIFGYTVGTPISTMKVAATRQVKAIRQLVQRGDIEGAESMVRRLDGAGVLKKTPQGTQIKSLGGGAEGPATLVSGAVDAPDGMLAVRKAYDTKAPLFSKRLLAEKHNFARRATAAQKLKDSPIELANGGGTVAVKDTSQARLANLYSNKIRKGKGGTPYQIHEYVKGKKIGDVIDNEAAEDAVESWAKSPTGNKRIQADDVVGHPDNTIIDSATGQPVVIDALPKNKRIATEQQEMSGKDIFSQKIMDHANSRESGWGTGRKFQDYVSAKASSKAWSPMIGHEPAPSQFDMVQGWFGLRQPVIGRADQKRALQGL